MADATRPAARSLGGAGRHGFQELVQRRVQRILLVASAYDSFTMSEEGSLSESLLGHVLDLNKTHTPDLSQARSGAQALAIFRSDPRYDLIVVSQRPGDIDPAELCSLLRAEGHEVPVMALAHTPRGVTELRERADAACLEGLFLWQGDVRLLLAMVMLLEDRLNVEHDTGVMGVPALIVVEDNVRFYSSFLPTIYTELSRHTHALLSEDLNVTQQRMRMRARPKVLLAETYEEALTLFERYEQQIIGVISDFEYAREGKLDPHAGLHLCRHVRAARSDVRLVLQSSKPENRRLADEIGASFLLKGSPTLLHELREILIRRFGFGAFVFRMPDQSEVDRAHDLQSFVEKLQTVPVESVAYHASRNHFSNWLKARTEFALAERLRPLALDDFPSLEAMREHLLDAVGKLRRERKRSAIADFDAATFDPTVSVTRLGRGAIGGKARGFAFGSRVLAQSGLDERFPAIDFGVPPAVVLGTEVFDEFVERGQVGDFALAARSDARIIERFRSAPLPERAAADLRAYLERVDHPLSVRSSSLLEDSISQPFAGVYQTVVLPNSDPDLEVRWQQLMDAVKRVYASTFTEAAKTYLSMTSFRLEEEKMAVMVQRLVGLPHGPRFYPDFAGVARSHNFYPELGHAADEGVVAVALGLGHTVVDGERCLRFCPRHPRQIAALSSVRDALASSQREFYALDLHDSPAHGLASGVRRHPLATAEADGTLHWLGSTYTSEDDRIIDGLSRPGTRLVTFAQVLKHDAYPLSELLDELLCCCVESAGIPIEIEFAGNLARAGRRAEFALLQLRPLAMLEEREAIALDRVDAARVVCRSHTVLGNGRFEGLRDLVIVSPAPQGRASAPEIALQVAHYDAKLRKEKRGYVLIGSGRWGSSDPALGVPVTWSQICGARVIVEAGLEGLGVEPSQGSHFFHNLAASQVGYFTIDPQRGALLDREWLARLPSEGEVGAVRHVRLEQPLDVRISGRTGEGVILKPAES